MASRKSKNKVYSTLPALFIIPRSEHIEVSGGYGCGSDDYLFNVCDEIDTGLYLGDMTASHDHEKMKKFDVIVNMTHQKSKEYQGKLHLHVPIEDTTKDNISPILEWLVPKILSFLSDGKMVFVHCQAGISRSSSIVIGCLMRKNGLSFDNALEFVKSKRKQRTSPNFGFQFALENF